MELIPSGPHCNIILQNGPRKGQECGLGTISDMWCCRHSHYFDKYMNYHMGHTTCSRFPACAKRVSTELIKKDITVCKNCPRV